MYVLPPSSGIMEAVPLKCRSTIILHGSTSQTTILDFILAAVRTWNLTNNSLCLSRACFIRLQSLEVWGLQTDHYNHARTAKQYWTKWKTDSTLQACTTKNKLDHRLQKDTHNKDILKIAYAFKTRYIWLHKRSLLFFCKVSGSHGGEHEDESLLGYRAEVNK
jgi:hypothetical protein